MNNLIKLQVNNTNKFFIVTYAKDWFKGFDLPYFIQEKDYIVGYFYDFHDGEKSNIEGLTTISICKKLNDAVNNLVDNWGLDEPNESLLPN